MGILNVLLQWSAILQILRLTSIPQSENPAVRSQSVHTQWGLIQEFQDITEGEVENYLPQVTNILLPKNIFHDKNVDERMLHFLELVLLEKCENCLPFGKKFSDYLKVYL